LLLLLCPVLVNETCVHNAPEGLVVDSGQLRPLILEIECGQSGELQEMLKGLEKES